MFDSVSILFSDVVTFTEICSRISPMEVVSMLNAMYSLFDTLTERNRVYKVFFRSFEKKYRLLSLQGKPCSYNANNFYIILYYYFYIIH